MSRAGLQRMGGLELFWQHRPPHPLVSAALPRRSVAGCAVGCGSAPSWDVPRCRCVAHRTQGFARRPLPVALQRRNAVPGEKLPKTHKERSAARHGQASRACAHSRVPSPGCRNHPCLRCSPFAFQQGRRHRAKKFAWQAGRRAHTPCFAKCIRSIPATNRLAGALSGTREGRAM